MLYFIFVLKLIEQFFQWNLAWNMFWLTRFNILFTNKELIDSQKLNNDACRFFFLKRAGLPIIISLIRSDNCYIIVLLIISNLIQLTCSNVQKTNRKQVVTWWTRAVFTNERTIQYIDTYLHLTNNFIYF